MVNKYRYKIVFSYDGSLLFGYAKQIDKRTIQGEIEKVLSTIFCSNITIYASGRTDKGQFVKELIKRSNSYRR